VSLQLGNHEELIQIENGHYKALYKKQFENNKEAALK